VSEQPGRYQRSTGGMVGAMLVLVAVVVGWVGFRAVTSDKPERPERTVDYARAVTPARKAASFDLAAPPQLPAGWRATTVRFTPGADQHWHLGVLTDEDRYVGLEQADDSVASMVEEYVDEAAEQGRPVDVAGNSWSTYTDDGGDLALVRRQGRTTTLVVGHEVPRADLTAYAASLR
jgi:hypothetical protein